MCAPLVRPLPVQHLDRLVSNFGDMHVLDKAHGLRSAPST